MFGCCYWCFSNISIYFIPHSLWYFCCFAKIKRVLSNNNWNTKTNTNCLKGEEKRESERENEIERPCYPKHLTVNVIVNKHKCFYYLTNNTTTAKQVYYWPLWHWLSFSNSIKKTTYWPPTHHHHQHTTFACDCLTA